MPADRYTARRYCAGCGCDTEVSITVLPAVIKMDCSECWGSWELPKVTPNG